MGSIYGQCLRCQIAFEVPNVFGGIVDIQSSSITCPQCGQPARILDGRYESFGPGPSNFSARYPQDAAIVSALQNAYRLAKQGKAVEEIISEIEKVSPEASQAAHSAFARGGIRMLVLFIYLLVSACDSFNVSATLNINKALDQLHVYATGAEPYPDLGSSPPEPRQASTDETGSIRGGSARPSGSERTPKQTRQQRRHSERQANKHLRAFVRTSAPKPKGAPKT